MDIPIKAQLTPDDYVNAQYLNGRRKAYFLYAFLMICFFGIIALCIMVIFENSPPPTIWALVLGGFLLSLLAGLYTVPKAIRRRTKKLFAQQTSLQVPRDIRITDSHLYAISDRGDAKIPWEDFHKWKVNEKIILIYPSDIVFHMFPRRWFASDGDFQDFQNLLARMIGPAGKPRKRT